MNKLLNRACKISEACNTAICASVAWSGAARFINTFAQSGPTEREAYLRLCNQATRITVLEFVPLVSEIIARVSTPPVKTIPKASQVARQKAAGKTDADIKLDAEYVFSKKVARYNEQMAVLKRNKKDITDALELALSTPVSSKKLPQMAHAIIEGKVMIKLAERDATLTDMINDDIMVDANESEQDIIWEFLDDVQEMRATA